MDVILYLVAATAFLVAGYFLGDFARKAFFEKEEDES